MNTQAGIHTGFHRFTEIDQTFENYSEAPKKIHNISEGNTALDPSRTHSLFRKSVTNNPGSAPKLYIKFKSYSACRRPR